MNNYDIILVGGGLTGSILAYELAQYDLKILLLEKNTNFQNATAYSYGGIFYWCGTDNLTKQLCAETREIYPQLEQELEADIELRNIDLLFTINKEQNPQEIYTQYQKFLAKPDLLFIRETCDLEPLLNPETINGCLRFPQTHVNPQKLVLAYQNAFVKRGGKIAIAEVNSLINKENKTIGVKTNQENFFAEETVICAGGFSRQLLAPISNEIPIYFAHTQLIKTPPSDLKLNSLVMPASLARFTLQEETTTCEKKTLWNNPNDKIQATAIEAGGVQFADGSFCLGQISQVITNPLASVDAKSSEKQLRQSISEILPQLANLKGTWYNCQVAFTKSQPFQVGKIQDTQGLSIFSGFTSPFVFVPPLAKHFANFLVNQDKPISENLDFYT